MAADTPTKQLPANPCCVAWKLECEKMKRMKHAYKDTVDVLKNALEKTQAEISNLKKKQQEEGVKTRADEETREREAAARISLEKEVSDLKSEISSLQQRLDQNLREKNDEMMLLQGQVSKGEKEIGQLKELLQKEKSKAGKAEEKRKKICEQLKQTKAQQSASKKKKDIEGPLKKLLENEKFAAESERKKADQYLLELEALKADAEKTSSKLAAMKSSCENVSNQLKLEKQKTLKEEKRADMESAKAMDQKKLVGSLSKQLEEVKASNEKLKKEMELKISICKSKNAEDLAKIEEQTRLLEVSKKTAMECKSRADDLAQQLKEARFMAEDLQKQLEELSSSKKSLDCLHKERQMEDLEMLRKELKFERKRVKHAKQLAKLEKVQREVLVDEMSRLKLEFVHSLNRLNLLDGCFSTEGEGTDDLLGKGNSRRKPLRSNKLSQEVKNLIGRNKTCDARYNVVAINDCQKQTQPVPAKLTSKSGRELSESVSGTISESKSLIGGCRNFQISGVNSSATSFSDGQYVASQERGQFSVTTSAEIGKDNMDIQTTNANISPRVSNTSNNENLCLGAGNYLQSQQTDSCELVDKHLKERKRMAEAVESLKYLHYEDKRLNLQIGEKLISLHSMLVGNVSRMLEEERTLLPDLQGSPRVNCDTITMKRKASDELKRSKKKKVPDAQTCVRTLQPPAGHLTGSVHVSGQKVILSSVNDAENLAIEEGSTGNFMKLLELDNPEDEEHYNMARELPLSPYLPVVNFEGGDMVVDEGEHPPMANSNDVCGTIDSNEALNLHTQNALMAVGTLSVSDYEPLRSRIPKFFVLYSTIKDTDSVIRIIHSTKRCIERCPSAAKAEWAVPEILLSVKMEENLPILERACVLLSLLLHNFSMAVSMMKIDNILNADALSCLDSFSKHICEAITNAKAGELLDELLGLLQDFLCEQKILCYVPESASSINACVDDETIALSQMIAPIDCLVAGSGIFAAICSSADRVGFICEASFEIIYKHSQEKTSVLLTVLHVFAYVAGEKMFSSREHSLPITVLKSIMKFLEDRYLREGKAEMQLHPGEKCPFSDGSSSSMEDITSTLLEILQKFARSRAMKKMDQSPINPTHEDLQCILGLKCEASSSIGLSENQPAAMDSSALCQLCDILSLIELLVAYLAWDWTCANVISPLLNMLETPLAMDFSIAVVSLLGQLGSIGVDANGFDEQGIRNMRDKLSEYLQCETILRAGFAVQIATVSSLLKLLPSDVQKTIEKNDSVFSGCPNVSSCARLIAKWFSLLSKEQQTFASEFLQTSPVHET